MLTDTLTDCLNGCKSYQNRFAFDLEQGAVQHKRQKERLSQMKVNNEKCKDKKLLFPIPWYL